MVAKQGLDTEELISSGELTNEMANFLETVTKARKTTLIYGATAMGMTTICRINSENYLLNLSELSQ